MMSAARAWAAPGRTYTRISEGKLTDWWHCNVGVSTSSGAVTSWISRVLGISAAPAGVPNRPPYGADGSAFGGKSVVQCQVTGNKALRASGFSGLAAAGSNPRVFVRARWRDAAVANGILLDTYNGTTVIRSLTHRINTTGTSFVFTNTTTANATKTGGNTGVHSFTGWHAATTINLQVDGVGVSTADAFPLDGAITSLSFGIRNISDAQQSNASMALVLWIASDPGSAILGELENLAAAEFPA